MLSSSFILPPEWKGLSPLYCVFYSLFLPVNIPCHCHVGSIKHFLGTVWPVLLWFNIWREASTLEILFGQRILGSNNCESSLHCKGDKQSKLLYCSLMHEVGIHSTVDIAVMFSRVNSWCSLGILEIHLSVDIAKIFFCGLLVKFTLMSM